MMLLLRVLQPLLFLTWVALPNHGVLGQSLLVEDARGACDEPGMCDWDNTNNIQKRMMRRRDMANTQKEEAQSDYIEDSRDDNDIDWVWKSGTVQDIKEALDCEAQMGSSVLSQFYQEDTWKLLQNTYRSVVENEQSSSTSSSSFSSGFVVDFKVQLFEAVGRGVVATQAIPKGTLVWTTANTARFTRGQDYRAFLKALPSYLACDVLYWAYTRQDTQQQPVVCVDLDEGSFVNSGDQPEDVSIGFLSGKQEQQSQFSGCKMEFYALRDIQAGEEMRGDYSAFAELLWHRLSL